MPEPKPVLYALYYYNEIIASGGQGMLGIYSSEEGAKTEAQRYHKKVPLDWRKMTTDSNRIHAMFSAKATTWAVPTTFEITAFRLDSRAFRP